MSTYSRHQLSKIAGDALKALASEFQIPGRSKMTANQVRDAIFAVAGMAGDVSPPAAEIYVEAPDSGVSLGSEVNRLDESDPLTIPAILRRPANSPEERQAVDRLVAQELYGHDRKWIMPGGKGSSFQAAPKTATAKKKGSQQYWVFAPGGEATDAQFAELIKPLPKQAKAIAAFVRSEGKVTYDKLIERARHFLTTKQEPDRVVVYYRGALIAAGVVRVTYDDPSIPVEDQSSFVVNASTEKLLKNKPVNLH